MHTHDQSQPATFLAHITDTTDDRARLKILAAYAKHGGDLGLRADIVAFSPAHSTLDIGIFVSEQINNTERPDRLILGINCAAPDNKTGENGNARKDFYYGELEDNVFVGGTLKGLELSYVKGDVKRLFQLTSTNKLDSQFRSLQILPEHLVKFTLPGERDKLIKSGDLLDVSDDIDTLVPDVPEITHVFEVDNFGNVKLWLSAADRALLNTAEGCTFQFGDGSVEQQFLIQAAEQNDGANTNVPQFNGLVTPTLFAAKLGTDLIALSSSSVLRGGLNVPIIATIRERPAETTPNYPLPTLGQPVRLQSAAKASVLAA